MHSDLIEIQRQRNVETRDAAEFCADHRRRVMLLLEATADELRGPDEDRCHSLVVLGAGNCSDVDLKRLTELFQQVHLVDVDETALQRAVAEQPEVQQQIGQHAPVDIADPLLSLTPQDFAANADNAEHCAQVLQQLSSDRLPLEIPDHSCDTVASLCVLTPLIGSLAQLIGEQHPAFINAVKALRIGHLRRLLKLLRPGGIGILITDIVSSDTVPELPDTSPQQLPELVKQLVTDQNFFTGANPALLLGDLNLLERLPAGPDTAQVFDPWLWHLGPRSFAVYGVRFQSRRPAEALAD